MTGKWRGDRRIGKYYYEALMKAPLNRSGYKIVLAIIDKSWGYHKERERITLTTFQELTSLSRPAVIAALRRLEKQQVIEIERNGRSHVFSINDWHLWEGAVW